MKATALDRRVTALEGKQPDAEDADRSMTRAFLSKLTVEELRRLRDILTRIEDGQKGPTEEEACFLAELEAKYGF
jgi:hypothetical protein